MGERELRISRRGAHQKLACLQDVLFRASEPEGSGPQVPLVGFRVVGEMAHEPAALIAAQSQSDAFIHDGAGDLVLNRYDFCRGAVVRVAP